MIATMVVLAAVVVFVVVFVSVFLLMPRYRLRFSQLRAWAQAHGFTFSILEPAVPGAFPGTPAERAQGGYARNVVRGRAGPAQAVAFDCMAERGFNNVAETYTLAALSLPSPVPVLQVSREGHTDRLARGLGFRDVEFENDEFNRRYKVSTADREFAYDVLAPRVIEWLLATDGPDWQLTGSSLVCWHPGGVSPAVLDADLAFLTGLLANIPQVVWEKAR